MLIVCPTLRYSSFSQTFADTNCKMQTSLRKGYNMSNSNSIPRKKNRKNKKRDAYGLGCIFKRKNGKRYPADSNSSDTQARYKGHWEQFKTWLIDMPRKAS